MLDFFLVGSLVILRVLSLLRQIQKHASLWCLAPIQKHNFSGVRTESSECQQGPCTLAGQDWCASAPCELWELLDLLLPSCHLPGLIEVYLPQGHPFQDFWGLSPGSCLHKHPPSKILANSALLSSKFYLLSLIRLPCSV